MILEALAKVDPKMVLSFGLDAVGVIITCLILLRIGVRTYEAVENYRWHRNPKEGDHCYFRNIGGGITECTVGKVSEDKKKVLLRWGTSNSSGSGWYDLSVVKYLSETDREILREARLRNLTKRLRNYRG